MDSKVCHESIPLLSYESRGRICSSRKLAFACIKFESSSSQEDRKIIVDAIRLKLMVINQSHMIKMNMVSICTFISGIWCLIHN